jgi:glycerol-3-phosphate dehydrogenase
MRQKLMFKAAFLVNDLVAKWQNQGGDGQRNWPSGRLISREAFAERAGWIPAEATGGAMWYDGLMCDSERLLLAVVLSAEQAGAVVANYAAAKHFLGTSGTVTGVRAQDELTGQQFDIRARLVINCAGAWADALLSKLDGRALTRTSRLSVAVNMVTKQLCSDYALGLSGRRPPMAAMATSGKWVECCLSCPGSGIP